MHKPWAVRRRVLIMASGWKNRIGLIRGKRSFESHAQLSSGFLFKKFILLTKSNFSLKNIRLHIAPQLFTTWVLVLANMILLFSVINGASTCGFDWQNCDKIHCILKKVIEKFSDCCRECGGGGGQGDWISTKDMPDFFPALIIQHSPTTQYLIRYCSNPGIMCFSLNFWQSPLHYG